MNYQKLEPSDLKVSEIAMGCWGIVGGPNWGPQDETDSVATIETALDIGINFFDTAEGYGDGYSEQVLGKALTGRRHEAVIASKFSRRHMSAPNVRAACERSLRRLNTDYIDLYQFHWPSRSVPIDETMGELVKLRDEGKIREIGACNFGVKDMDDLLAIGAIIANQLPYSLLWRAIEFEIQPSCIEKQIGILAYSPLLHGMLAGKYATPEAVPDGRARTRHFSRKRAQTRHDGDGCETETFLALDKICQVADRIGKSMAVVAVAWVLQQTGVTSVIAGARQPRHITDFAGDLSLSADVVQELNDITEPVKQLLGPNADMWETESRFR